MSEKPARRAIPAEGLRVFEERECRDEAALAEMRAEIAAGLASLDRGEGAPGDEIFAKLEARLAAHRAAAGLGESTQS